MKIATWNVNSIRTRLHQLLPWLKDSAPDVVLLQELKCTNDTFPAMEIEEMGYNLALKGQKTYNGVAILSKFPLSDVTIKLSGDDSDEHARYIEAVVNFKDSAMRVASVYVPNGQSPDSEKFPYKLKFLERLHAHMELLRSFGEVAVIGGDYNVAPFARDVARPEKSDGMVCYHPEERLRLRKILNNGWYDAFRTLYPHEKTFSWWDYREAAFEHAMGLRIDHLLLSPQAADKLESCTILRDMRATERPSDHVPVMCALQV